MTNVLVTGGAGFVGSHIVDRYVDEGYDVTVIDDLIDQVHDEKPDYLNDAVDYVWGDVRDGELMAGLLEKADILNHQASAVGVGQSMYEIEEYVEINTLGTARILDIIVNENIDLDRMIVASSMTIYGEGEYYCVDCDSVKHPSLRDAEQMADGEWELFCPDCDAVLEPKPTPESRPRESTNIYAITKKTQEEMCLSIGQAYDIPTISLRYFNVYGSRQSLDNPYTGVCAIFSSRIKNDNSPLIFEDGEQTRDFVHVNDVVQANVAALETNASNIAVNIGSGTPTTIREVADTLIDLYDKSDELEPEIADDYREGDIRHCYADTTKAGETLGFEAEIGFEEGLRELVEWGRDQNPDDSVEEAHSELKEKGLTSDN